MSTEYILWVDVEEATVETNGDIIESTMWDGAEPWGRLATVASAEEAIALGEAVHRQQGDIPHLRKLLLEYQAWVLRHQPYVGTEPLSYAEYDEGRTDWMFAIVEQAEAVADVSWPT